MKFFNTLIVVWSLYFTQIGVTYAVDRSANKSTGARETNGGGESLVKSETYLSMLVMLAVGFSTAGLLRSCDHLAVDTALGGIGGLAYTVGEVMAMMKYKQYDIDRNIKYQLSFTKLDASAREEISNQKEMYENTLKILELKYKMQIAAAAAWGVAGITAGTQHFMLRNSYRTFSASLSSVSNACKPLSPICPKAYNSCHNLVAGVNVKLINDTTKDVAEKSTPVPSQSQCVELYRNNTENENLVLSLMSQSGACISNCQAELQIEVDLAIAKDSSAATASAVAQTVHSNAEGIKIGLALEASNAVQVAENVKQKLQQHNAIAGWAANPTVTRFGDALLGPATVKAVQEKIKQDTRISETEVGTANAALEKTKVALEASIKPVEAAAKALVVAKDIATATLAAKNTVLATSAFISNCVKEVGLAGAASKQFTATNLLSRSCCTPTPPPVAQAMPFDREFLKDKGVDFFEDQFAIGYNPQDTQKNAIESYIDYRDTMSMRDGATHSMSIGEYQTLKKIINPQNSEMEHFYKYTLASYMKAGAKFILPEANAFDFMSPTTWGVATAALVILTTMVFTSWQWLDQMMAGPGRRAIVWGTLSAFSAATALLFTKKGIDKMEKNIESLDTILKQMDRMATMNSVSGAANLKLQVIDLKKDKGINIFLNPPGQGAASGKCLFPQNSGGKCPDANSVLADQGGAQGLTGLPAFSSVTANAGKFANDFQKNGTLTTAGFNAAAGMGSNFGAIRKKLDEVEKSLAQASGGKFDLAKVQNNFFKGLLDKQKESFKRKNLDPQTLATAFGTSNVPAGDIKPEELADAAKKDLQMINGNSGAGGSAETMNINVGDTPAEEAVAGGAETSQPSGPNLDGFKLKSEDLIKNTDVPIWQALSMRYLKTGYPLLLEEKPVETSAPKP